jgi:mRNA-degrading endonuclease RelE of RelBE toxin-antitoxin system
VAKYSLEIKQSAQKELDVLDNAVFARIDRKILVLADNPRPAPARYSVSLRVLSLPKALPQRHT